MCYRNMLTLTTSPKDGIIDENTYYLKSGKRLEATHTKEDFFSLMSDLRYS